MISSRTYLSSLEGAIKNPTLEKIDSIAAQLQIHPATLIVSTYLQNQHAGDETQEDLLNQIQRGIEGAFRS